MDWYISQYSSYSKKRVQFSKMIAHSNNALQSLTLVPSGSLKSLSVSSSKFAQRSTCGIPVIKRHLYVGQCLLHHTECSPRSRSESCCKIIQVCRENRIDIESLSKDGSKQGIIFKKNILMYMYLFVKSTYPHSLSKESYHGHKKSGPPG